MATTSEDDLRAFFLLFKKLSADPSVFERVNVANPRLEAASERQPSYSRVDNDSIQTQEEDRAAQKTRDVLSTLLQCVDLSDPFIASDSGSCQPPHRARSEDPPSFRRTAVSPCDLKNAYSPTRVPHPLGCFIPTSR